MILKKYYTQISFLGLIYCAIIWGSTFTIVKSSLDNIDPIVLVGYRFSIAAIILGIYLKIKGEKIFRNFSSGLLLGILICALYLTQTIGLKFTTASNSAFITGLFVAFVPILALLIFKRKPGIREIIAVLVSSAGLYLITGGMHDVNKGDLLTIIAAMTYAMHILFADRYVKRRINLYVLSFQQFLIVGLMSLLLALISERSFTISNTETVLTVIFLALFPTLSAFIIQLVSQKYITPINVSLIFALEPVSAAVFAWTVGGEELLIIKAVGGALIVAATMIVSVRIKKKIVEDSFRH